MQTIETLKLRYVSNKPSFKIPQVDRIRLRFRSIIVLMSLVLAQYWVRYKGTYNSINNPDGSINGPA